MVRLQNSLIALVILSIPASAWADWNLKSLFKDEELSSDMKDVKGSMQEVNGSLKTLVTLTEQQVKQAESPKVSAKPQAPQAPAKKSAAQSARIVAAVAPVKKAGEPEAKVSVERSEIKVQPKAEPRDVSLAELTGAEPLFHNFKAAFGGNGKNRHVRLFGTMPEACQSHFSFETHQNIEKGITAFRIKDLGDGKECVKKNKNGQLVSLSKLDNTIIILPEKIDVDVGLISENKQEDENSPNRLKLEVLTNSDGQALRHIGSNTLNKEKAAEKEDQKRAAIEQAKEQLSKCRKDREELAIAAEAVETLETLGAMTAKEAERERKRIAKDTYIKIATAFARAKDHDTLIELKDELQAFAGDHEGYAEVIAKLFLDKAKKITSGASASHEVYENARSLIEAAKELPGISEKTEKRLIGHEKELKVEELTKRAQSKDAGSAEFRSDLSSMLSELYDESSACQPQMGYWTEEDQGELAALTETCEANQLAYNQLMMAGQTAQQTANQLAMEKWQARMRMMGPTAFGPMAQMPGLAGPRW